MVSPSDATDAVDRAVAEGRRCSAARLKLRAAGWGVALSLVVPLLLLVMGSEWIPYALVWIGLAGGIAAAIAVWRDGRVSGYDVARALDRRWESADQVSTAYYFSAEGAADPKFVQAQRRQAARAAEHRDPREAFDDRLPRSLWWAAAALSAAVVLVGVRYGVEPTLGLNRALAPLVLPDWAGPENEEVASLSPELGARSEADASSGSASTEQLAEALEAAEGESSMDASGALSEDADQASAEAEGLDAPGDQLSFDPADEQSVAGAEPGDEGSPDEQGSSLDRENQSTQPEDTGGDWSEQSNSLLDRLRDALQQLGENMDFEPPEAGQTGTASQQDGEAPQTQGGEETDGQAADGQGAPSEASMESDETSQEGAQQASQGSGEESGSGSEGDGESAGAAGDGEGSKELAQLAAQQAAFEELEEFYLQRAEEISGDVLVETSTSEAHGATSSLPVRQSFRREGSGVAVRDEAPAAYRTFVENYFREIRSREE